MATERLESSIGTNETSFVLLRTTATIGSSVFIFGISFFCCSLLLSWLISPDRFPVRIGEKYMTLRQLQEEEVNLERDRVTLNTERIAALAKVSSPLSDQLAAVRARHPRLGDVLAAAVLTSQKVSVLGRTSLQLTSIRMNEGVLRIEGIATDPGDQSQNVLSSFIDLLRAHPSVLRVTEPEYRRQDLPDGSSSSPFTITLYPHA